MGSYYVMQEAWSYLRKNICIEFGRTVHYNVILNIF
jgi:hypothetical protein